MGGPTDRGQAMTSPELLELIPPNYTQIEIDPSMSAQLAGILSCVLAERFDRPILFCALSDWSRGMVCYRGWRDAEIVMVAERLVACFVSGRGTTEDVSIIRHGIVRLMSRFAQVSMVTADIRPLVELIQAAAEFDRRVFAETME